MSDIVYYCGPQVIEWHYNTQSLGGSEQAVVHLCKEWARMDYDCTVFANFTFKDSRNEHGVTWSHHSGFERHSVPPKVVILWRGGIIALESARERWPSACIVADLHDNSADQMRFLADNQCKHNGVFVKSLYHLEYMQVQSRRRLARDLAYVVPNGVRTDIFEEASQVTRDPHAFIYCSSYDRGLLQLLQWTWPRIKQRMPEATLDVYYGIGWVRGPERDRILSLLEESPGVTDHGRKPAQVVCEAKQRCSFHLYYTKTPSETDCISIRESTLCGCIPILSKHGVFSERAGLHLEGDPATRADHEKAADAIVEWIQDADAVEETRRQMIARKSMHVSWEWVAKQWIKIIGVKK